MINSVINHTSRFVVKVDIVLDYIPFVSTLSNMVDLVAKAVFAIMASYFPSIRSNPLVKHLEEKNILHIVLLAIPFVNFYIACFRCIKEGSEGNEDLEDLDDSPTISRSSSSEALLGEEEGRDHSGELPIED